MDSDVSFPAGWPPPPGRGAVAMATVCLLITSGMVFWAGARKAQIDALRREGREVIGQVKQLSRWRGNYNVTYAFNTNGLSLRATCTAPARIWNSFQEGDFLPIRFLPSNPAVNHPAALEKQAPSDLGRLFGLAVAAWPGVMVLYRLRRDRRLVAEGVPAAAMVTNCEKGGKGSWWIKYQFRTENETLAEGSDRLRLGVGSTLCILYLYLRENPRRNLPYLRCWYRARA